MENEELKTKVGLGLRALRSKKGLTQEDLERFGISHRYYRRIETGKANPTIETLARLCDVLGSTMPELFALIGMDPPLSNESEAVLLKVLEILRSEDVEKIRKLKLIVEQVL